MYAVIRRRQADQARQEETIRRIEEGLVPLLRAIPGFVSYGVATSGDLAQTLNIYQDQAGADESTRVAAAWVRENRPAGVPAGDATVISGEVRVHKPMPQRSLAYGVTRDYRVDPANVDEIVRRAEAGFVPLISAAPGFANYTLIDAGGGRVVTLSGFEDEAGAAASVALAADWVKEHLAPLVPSPPEVTTLQIRLRVLA